MQEDDHMPRLRHFTGLALAGVVALAPVGGLGPTEAQAQQPGFNLFSVEQDIELGRQSAIAAERELPLLNNRAVDAYLNRVVRRLAQYAPGARYPYEIKAVNASEINAFALPGGPMYVNRGLVEAARNEAELAGVLAHEMAHVALRHGTHQASKVYLTRSGLGILGGLLGKSSGTSRIVNTIGGVGLNAVFLKFSRDDEYEADQVGVDIMAKAGYDPRAMATFFAQLRQVQGRDPSKLEQFFSSHPAPANREDRIRQLAANTGGGARRTQIIGGFATVQSSLARLPEPGTQRVALEEPDQQPVPTGQVAVRVDPASTRFQQFRHPQNFFTIDYPENWEAYSTGLATSIAPQGGVANRSDGQPVMLYGVIINHYAPFEGEETRREQSLQRSYAPFEDRTKPRGTLEDATDDLVRTIQSANPYLRTEVGSAQRLVIDGAAGFTVDLSGPSPATGQEERVKVYTRALSDGHVVYVLGISPATQAAEFDRTFDRMMRTLSINDAAAHRATRVSLQPR
jgi:Zn-dependent protease with chaperone function